MSDLLYIGGKARPGNQTELLKEAGFSVYEAVIIGSEDWKGLEYEAEKGLFPSSIDIKGKESEQRWKELRSHLSLLTDLSISGPLGFVYVGVDGFPENIDQLRRLNYEFKAIEALPATSPAALEAKTSFPEDLIRHVKSSDSKVLVDICHLFQTAVFLQSQQAPLEVILRENGTYLTKIRPGAAERYHQMFQEIADSGYLAPFVHTNGHAFVADQIPPKEGEKDSRLYLPDGRLIRAYDEKAVTLADWGNNQDAYNKNSYAVPITINGQRMVAQWFKTHLFVTDEQDEIYKTLDVHKSTQQLISSGIMCMILENGKESAGKLRQDANLFYKVVSELEELEQ